MKFPWLQWAWLRGVNDIYCSVKYINFQSLYEFLEYLNIWIFVPDSNSIGDEIHGLKLLCVEIQDFADISPIDCKFKIKSYRLLYSTCTYQWHHRVRFFLLSFDCDDQRITIYAPVNIMAMCIIFSGGQIHYEGG